MAQNSRAKAKAVASQALGSLTKTAQNEMSKSRAALFTTTGTGLIAAGFAAQITFAISALNGPLASPMDLNLSLLKLTAVSGLALAACITGKLIHNRGVRELIPLRN